MSDQPAAPVSEPVKPVMFRDRWALSLFVTLGFLLACTPLRTFDIWWSLRTGQLILERGWVPLTDWFTYTEPDNKWLDLHWGFQVLVTLVHRYAGVAGLVLTKATCLGITAALLWSSQSRRLPTWSSVMCWTLPLIVVSGRVMVRAEMLSFICLAAWLWTLSRIEKQPRWIWLLPVIQIGWTNCHGLFGVGFVIGSLWCGDWAVRRLLAGRWGSAPASPELNWPTVITGWLAFAFAPLVNPYGWEGLTMPFVLYKKLSADYDFYSQRINELMPLARGIELWGYHDVYLNAMLLLAGVTLLSFLAVWSRGRWSLLNAALFGAFLHLSLKSVRNMSLWGMICGWILARHLAELRELSQRSAEGQSPTESPLGRFAGRFALAGMCVAMISGVWPAFSNSPGLGLVEFPARFAHEAILFAGRPGMPDRAYIAGYGTAGLYTYHHGPERRLFMDGRLETASRRTFELYEQVRYQMRDRDPRWQDVIRDERGHLPVVILDRAAASRSIAGLAQTPGWRAVYSDSLAVVFVEDAVADRLELQAVPTETR